MFSESKIISVNQIVISKKVDFLSLYVLTSAFLDSMKSFLESKLVFKGQTYPLVKMGSIFGVLIPDFFGGP